MKRTVILISSLLLSFSYVIAQQKQQVTREDAIKVAFTKMYGTLTLNRDISKIPVVSEMKDDRGNTILYEITMDSISMLLSGSKACYPIIGKYIVTNGPLLTQYVNLPDNIRFFLDWYKSQLEYSFRNDTLNLYYQETWDSLIHGSNNAQRDGISVGPLMSTKWGQKGRNNDITRVGYEFAMPGTYECEHCLAGCVAVAMGQVLNYWKHPVDTDWNYLYDWCNMSDFLDSTYPSFVQNRAAISKLLRDCGESVSMIYGCLGSGANFNNIQSALVYGFDFNPYAQYLTRTNYSNSDWMGIIRNQINMGLPVLYNACGISCHTFVCDGYDDDGLYFNWGALGNGNGTYHIDLLNPTFIDHQYLFPTDHQILINIYPNDRIDLCHRVVDLADYYTYWQNELEGHHPWDIPPTTATELTSADNASDALWRTIPEGASTTYKAHKSITLRDGFSVERGADFTAYIDPCAFCESGRGVPQNVSAPSISSLEQGTIQNESIDDTLNKSASRASIFTPSGNVAIYPNPTQEEMTVEIPNAVKGNVHIQIMDMYGRQILSHTENVDAVSYKQQMDIQTLPSGCYYAVVTANGNRIVKCIVKQK